ncbi:MAG TPA: zf-HC2 domain-containing protein [Terriglobia bacterium]|nr:zf-HC2 domain-containing protein [Terriglobia bacterium]
MNSQKDTLGGECLTDDLISGYLEGTLTPVVKAACEVHLVGCDRCRVNLATLMRLLRTEVGRDESAETELAVAEWDRRIVAKPRRGWATGTWKRVYSGFGIAAIVVLAVFVSRLPFRQPTAEDLVQEYLHKNRPFNAQMSSQPYLELAATRNPGVRPSYEGLAEEMVNRSADAYRMGRLHLANRNFDSAVPLLEKASQASGAASEVHNDLGVAYLQRAQGGDFERARREFELALRADDTFKPAVFNLALLYEISGLTEQAEHQWKRYLELDSDTGWAEEVRNKLTRKDLAR